MLRIVLDTNILLVSISERSPHGWIFRAFLSEKFELFVTTEILAEYGEVLSRHLGRNVAENVLLAIENAVNTAFITRYFKWQLISEDPDDNKFTNCAIAGNAEYLVTEDKHFNSLKGLAFPKVNILDVRGFAGLFPELSRSI